MRLTGRFLHTSTNASTSVRRKQSSVSSKYQTTLFVFVEEGTPQPRISGYRQVCLQKLFLFLMLFRRTGLIWLFRLCSGHRQPASASKSLNFCRRLNRLVPKLLNLSRRLRRSCSGPWNPDRWRCAVFPGARRGRRSNRAPFPRGFPEILRPSYSGLTIFEDLPVPFSLP